MGKLFKTFSAIVVGLALAGCGDNGTFFASDTGTSAAGALTLLVDSPQLGSSGSKDTTVTAIVKDSSNRLLEGVPVSFSASSGSIETTQGTTDTSGKATAKLNPGGDKSNRAITVSATTGTASQTVTVDVTGTSIAISGDTSIVIGSSLPLTITLTDSDDAPIAGETIAVSSALGNAISATTLTTNTAGQVQITLSASNPGTDTISVTGLGVSATHTVSISGDNFQFTAPVANSDIALSTNQTVTIHWEQNGTPKAGQTVSFSATRGTLRPTSATTDASGNASIQISSSNAGPSTVTAAVSGGPSASRSINFVATTAAVVDLQVDQATIGPNDGSQTSQQQATLTATVRDASNNLVKGKTVRFSILQDNSGGSLLASTAVTDSLGKASTTYVSSSATTAQNGVEIQAEVTEGTTTLMNTVFLTVARSALFVRLGTGNLVAKPTPTQYAKGYSVMVTDASGNAVPNVDVSIAIVPHQTGTSPKAFHKGYWTFPTGGTQWLQTVSANCANEDGNLDGILDSGEDINGNGVLDPGNIASAPSTVTTGTDGSATFDIVYAKEYATWVSVQLKASRTVAGTEASHTVSFYLPISGDDVTDQTKPPPGVTSPFGAGLQSAGNNDCSKPL